MTGSFTDRELADCEEGARLVDRAMKENDPDAYDRLLEQATRLLSPLVEQRMPDALYLYACYLLNREGLSDAEFDLRHVALIEAAAVQGHAKAQFAMGQFLDRGGELPYDAAKSAEWFRLSAEQGYPYAQWVHGYNLVAGIGISTNETLGLDFIRQAAEGGFGEAMRYMADSYAEGRHALPMDAQQSQYWRDKMKEPGVSEL